MPIGEKSTPLFPESTPRRPKSVSCGVPSLRPLAENASSASRPDFFLTACTATCTDPPPSLSAALAIVLQSCSPLPAIPARTVGDMTAEHPATVPCAAHSTASARLTISPPLAWAQGVALDLWQVPRKIFATSSRHSPHCSYRGALHHQQAAAKRKKLLSRCSAVCGIFAPRPGGHGGGQGSPSLLRSIVDDLGGRHGGLP